MDPRIPMGTKVATCNSKLAMEEKRFKKNENVLIHKNFYFKEEEEEEASVCYSYGIKYITCTKRGFFFW